MSRWAKGVCCCSFITGNHHLPRSYPKPARLFFSFSSLRRWLGVTFPPFHCSILWAQNNKTRNSSLNSSYSLDFWYVDRLKYIGASVDRRQIQQSHLIICFFFTSVCSNLLRISLFIYLLLLFFFYSIEEKRFNYKFPRRKLMVFNWHVVSLCLLIGRLTGNDSNGRIVSIYKSSI